MLQQRLLTRMLSVRRLALATPPRGTLLRGRSRAGADRITSRSLSTTSSVGNEDNNEEDAMLLSEESEGGVENTSGDTNSSDGSLRNRALAEIIRGGYSRLSQVATDIQSNPITRQSLFGLPARESSPRQKAEEHLLLITTKEVLEALTRKPEGKLVCVEGDPIMILKVEIKPGSRLATLYWSLPYSVLADDTLVARDKQILEFRMDRLLTQEGGGGALLQRSVHSALRHYYPPRLRFKPATDDLLLEALEHVWED